MNAPLFRFGRIPVGLAILLALPFMGCAETGDTEAGMQDTTEAPDAAEIESAIDEVNGNFVRLTNEGDVSGAVDATYTRDATILPPGGPRIQGIENIRGFWSDAGEQMGIERVDLATLSVEPMGPDHAYEIGRWTIGTAEGEQSGKYVVIWKRASGDDWRWHIDIWNENAEGMDGAGSGNAAGTGSGDDGM